MIRECRSCSSKKLENILSLGKLYLSDFVKDNKKPRKFELDLVVCKKCRLVQLKHTTPTNYLYTQSYGYRSGINQTMKKELKTIVQKTIKHSKFKQKDIRVVDIGANDGTLLSFYPKKFFRIAVDPVRKFAKDSKKHSNIVISDYFNIDSFYRKAGKTPVDIVTAISCFYDMEDPNKFVSDVKSILSPNGIFVIQQNYLLEMLKQNAFDNIVHEHLEYYSLLSLENLLKKFDLEVFDVELTNINGGSFRTFISRKGRRKINKSVLRMRQVERDYKLETSIPYKQFSKRINGNMKKLEAFIKSVTNDGKTVFIYGASTRGNTLIQYAHLNKKLIRYAVERNPEKWGTKIASLGIPIISESEARKLKPDYLLVLPWFFKEEFLEREQSYLKKGGHFIFPLPEFGVI